MFKIIQIVFLSFFVLLFCSCKGQLNTNCKKKFKHARDLTYVYPAPARQSALDSALSLTNECLLCDTIRKAAVELKITILIALKKYSEGMLFVDSLNDGDFTYGYQKKMMSKNFQALIYNSKNDIVKRNLVYADMSNDLEQYIKQQHLSDKEFEEIYIYLYSIKGNFLDSNLINKEVDSLQMKYPGKKNFFEYFKK